MNIKLTQRDKQELKKWFEEPVKYKGHTIQLTNSTLKEYEQFCKLANAYTKKLKTIKGIEQ